VEAEFMDDLDCPVCHRFYCDHTREDRDECSKRFEKMLEEAIPRVGALRDLSGTGNGLLFGLWSSAL
jgi:histidinol phosphatase-like enzyme